MEERTEPLFGKKKNITRFRKDKRYAVAAAIHSVAVLGMLAIFLFTLICFHEELTPENFRRVWLSLRSAEAASDPFTEYRFESGLQTECVPLGEGLAVISADRYSYIGGLGTSFSSQLNYQNPALCVSERTALIYDRSGKNFCVTSPYMDFLRETLSSPILDASINQAGAFALVTDEEGYRAAVTVYSARQKLLCKWMTSQYYVMKASVSPDSSRFAALCFCQDGLSLSTEIKVFRIGEEEALWSYSLGKRQVYSMTHDKSGGLLILCDDGYLCLDEAGTVTESGSFSVPPDRFAATESGDLLVAFAEAQQNVQRVRFTVIGEGGSVRCNGTANGALRAVACRGGTGCVLTKNGLTVIPFEEGEKTRLVQISARARGVVCTENGNPIVIYSDRAEKLRLTEKEDY